jgi:dephospho-CoA kinase
MIFIAIAGPSGSGKTTLSHFFTENGIKVHELDKVAKTFYPLAAPQVESKFGKEVMNADGSINSKLLGKIVFSDRSKMNELNQIVLPIIWDKFMKGFFIRNHLSNEIVVFDIPILYEATSPLPWSLGMDYVIFVDASKEVRIKRLMEGRGINPETANMQANIFNYDKVALRSQDIKIDTTNGFEDMEKLKLWFKEIQKPKYADDGDERYTGWANLAL